MGVADENGPSCLPGLRITRHGLNGCRPIQKPKVRRQYKNRRYFPCRDLWATFFRSPEGKR